MQSREKGSYQKMVSCFFLCPDADCSRINLPNQVAPGTKYLPKYDELGNVKHIKMYDDCGREIGWGDYTNHGYGDINSPHYHTTPHWHEKIYNAQYPDGIKINHRTDVNTPLGDK